MILLGDFNGVFSLENDRTQRSVDNKTGKLPQSFFHLIETFKLDAWRCKHPREFTYFSEPNQSASRLDGLWITKDLTLRVVKIEIQPKLLSDHIPVFLSLKGKERGHRRWRPNEALLNNEEIIQKANKSLKEYFEFNLNKGTDIKIIWEAGKAVMRSFFMQ